MTISAIANVIIALGACQVAAGASSKFFYDEQDKWSDVPSSPPGSNQCDGSRQSPINLNTATYPCQSFAQSYTFYTGDCTLQDYKFTINDHSLKASLDECTCTRPTMKIPGISKEYELLQFHIHTGCENKLNNTGCDVNLHLVHSAKESIVGGLLGGITGSSSGQDLAVFDLMMYGVDQHNDKLDSLIGSWEEVDCTNENCVSVPGSVKGQRFSPYSLIPQGTKIYNFKGSLTTPPCSEVVTWNVSEKPVFMSFKQVLSLISLINFYDGFKNSAGVCTGDTPVADVAGLTSRDLQPINGRPIVKNCAPLKVYDHNLNLLSILGV